MPAKSSKNLRLSNTSHPVLYEVNIRVLLNELSAKAGKKIRLDTIPETLLDEWADLGFDAVWLMGVWSAGATGIQISREHQGLREDYKRVLPDLEEEDIVGSPYAVLSYTLPRALGGKKGLAALRGKLAGRGMGLVLDFVPNHTARDHAWVNTNPEFYINGKDGEEKDRPDFFFRTKTKKGERTIAFGRDPHFPGWTDTAQLNIFHPRTRQAMVETLMKIAALCDGVRCDMAMLILRQVFADTWGERSRPADAEIAVEEFWKEAIEHVKQSSPRFLFVGESYWNLEWNLQRLGFDYTYDKTLYDRLLHEGAGSVRDHLKATIEYQQRSARFIENHDEPRVAQALANEAWHYAAAMIASTVPGMLLLHEGQLDGRKVRVPVQLARRPNEALSPATHSFYERLLSCLESDVISNGEWRLLEHHAAWHDNFSYENILAYSWKRGTDVRLIVVNYAPMNSQCYITLQLDGMESPKLEFRDLMSSSVYVRDRLGFQNKGMYFDLPAYGMHLFEVKGVQ